MHRPADWKKRDASLRYVIERQYLVPLYEHILVEAPSFEDACRRALDDIEEPWGDNVETDYESPGPTTIEHAVEVPAGLDVGDMSLSYLMYEAGLDLLTVPPEPSHEKQTNDDVGFV